MIVQTGHALSSAAISRAAFSEKADLLATASTTNNQIVLWGTLTGKQLQTFDGHTGRITGLAIDEKLSLLISASEDGTVRVWNLQSGNQNSTIRTGSNSVTALSIVHPYHVIAYGTSTGEIVIHDISSATTLRSFRTGQSINAVGISTSAKWISAASSEALFYGDDVGPLRSIIGENKVKVLSFTSDESALVALDSTKLMRVTLLSGTVENDIAPQINMKGISDDATYGLALGNDNLAKLMTLSPVGEARSYLRALGDFKAIFSPDKRLLFAVSHETHTAAVYDLETGSPVTELKSLVRPITSQSVTHDGRYLLVGQYGQHAFLWDLRHGNTIGDFIVKQNSVVRSVGFVEGTPSMVWLASGTELNLWLSSRHQEVTAHRKQPFSFMGPVAPAIKSLHSSPNSELLLVQPHHNPIVNRPYVYKFDGYFNEIARGLFPSDKPIENVFGFSRDGKYLATAIGDNDIALWKVDNLQKHRVIQGKVDPLVGAAFSPDSKRIATVDGNGIVVMHDIETGVSKCRNIDAWPSTPVDLAFASDGSLLALAVEKAKTIQLRFIRPDCGKGPKEVEVPEGLTSLTSIGSESLFAAASPRGYVFIVSPKTNAVLCRIFNFGDEWLVVTPSGHFDSSTISDLPGAYWSSADLPFGTVPISAEGSAKFRPELLASIVQGEWLPPKQIKQPAITNMLPAPKITSINYDEQTGLATLTLSLTKSDPIGVRRDGPGSEEVRLLKVFRDETLVRSLPLGAVHGVARDQGSTEQLLLEGIAMPPKHLQSSTKFEAYIEIIGRGKGDSSVVTYHTQKSIRRQLGRAVVVTVGVNSYNDQRLNLRYAVNDARTMGASLRKLLSGSQQFSSVEGITLLSEGGKSNAYAVPNRENLHSLFARLAGKEAVSGLADEGGKTPETGKLGVNDTLIVHFSGHGFVDSEGTFHLAPVDIQLPRHSGDRTSKIVNSISSTELAAWLEPIEAKSIVIIIDACHSASAFLGPGRAPGPFGNQGLGQLAYDKKIRILAGSQAAELSVEQESLEHGLLTYTLLKHAEKKVIASHAVDDLSMNQWLKFAVDEVSAVHAEGRQGNKQALKTVSRNIKIRGQSYRGDTNYIPALVQRPVLYSYGRYDDDLVLWPGFRRDRSISADQHLEKASGIVAVNDSESFKTAETELKEAEFWYREAGDSVGIAKVLEQRGLLNIAIGQPEEAIQNMRFSQYYWAETGHDVERARFWLKIGELSLGLGNIKDAVVALDYAISLARKHSDWSVYKYALIQMARIMKSKQSLEIASALCRNAANILPGVVSDKVMGRMTSEATCP